MDDDRFGDLILFPVRPTNLSLSLSTFPFLIHLPLSPLLLNYVRDEGSLAIQGHLLPFLKFISKSFE